MPTPITVTAHYVRQGGTEPAHGEVEFTRTSRLLDAAGRTISVPVTTRARLVDGRLTVVLLANSDSEPEGTAYTVTERLIGTQPESWSLVLDASDGEVDLSTRAPAVAGPQLFTYATVGQLDAERTERQAADDALAADLAAEAAARAEAIGKATTGLATKDELDQAVLGEYDPSGLRPYPAWVAARPRIAEMLDVLDSGWSKFSAAGTLEWDTADKRVGSASMKLTTTSTGTVIARSPTFSPAVDLSDGYLGLWVKTESIADLTELTVMLSHDSFSSFVTLNIDTLPSQRPLLFDGEWTFVTVPVTGGATSGTPDMSAVNQARLRVRAGDAGAGVVVRFDGLSKVARPASGSAVSITFDDSRLSQYETAAPMMARYGFAATSYNIIDRIGVSSNAYTLENARELHRSYGWEQAAHAYYYANHPPNRTFLSCTDAELHEDFRLQRQWLVANGFAGGADHLAYPGGGNDRRVIDIASQYFASARTIQGRYETVPVPDPWRLRTVNVLTSTSPSTIENRIQAAVDGNHWLILTFHDIVETPANSSEYATTDFEAVLAAIDAAGIPVRTVGDVLTHGL